jgi:hypothetical protein
MANHIASDLIEEGIMSAFMSDEDYDEDDMLVDWVVVSYTDNPNKEKGGAYPMLFSNGVMPRYIAIGLLANGLAALKNSDQE